jgi:CheY-like chemotaxis protein
VLVIEDEPGVRAVISEALHDLGCTVLEAYDGTAGWQIVQSGAPLDLLITDVGLPGMNGRQVADAARALRPALPVLIITGYAGTALADLSLPAGMRLLRKPFALEALAPVVVELLGAGEASAGASLG